LIGPTEKQILEKSYENYKKEKSFPTTVRRVLGFPEDIISCNYLQKHPKVSQYFCENVCPIKKCKEKQGISL